MSHYYITEEQRAQYEQEYNEWLDTLLVEDHSAEEEYFDEDTVPYEEDFFDEANEYDDYEYDNEAMDLGLFDNY